MSEDTTGESAHRRNAIVLADMLGIIELPDYSDGVPGLSEADFMRRFGSVEAHDLYYRNKQWHREALIRRRVAAMFGLSDPNRLTWKETHAYLERAFRKDFRGDATDDLDAISNCEAARLLCDLLDLKRADPSRIAKLIKNAVLPSDANGKTSEGAVARYAQLVMKKRRGSRQAIPELSPTPVESGLACPRCKKLTHKLIGADKVCRDCFFQHHSTDDTTP
ncbi:MAG: hypothetical protein IID42_06880 [Planctomycetes bacterium]|nr:hypothetical protein [Planctomycetota bacterium]